MSTDHERALNRAKQKRFHERHPGYQAEKVRKKKARELPTLRCTGNYRTFELCDPFDPDKFPRVVTYCRVTTKPVWAKMWEVRHHSFSQWAKWFCALEKMGLEPEERETPWNVGVIFPVNLFVATYAVKSRLQRIKALLGVDSCWLLRGVIPPRVAYLTPQDGVKRFKSIAQAVRETGVSYRVIRECVSEIATQNGRTWFDD